MSYQDIRSQLEILKNEERRLTNSSFFKTGKGQYSEHDQFMGVRVPQLRVIAKDFKALALTELQTLISSSFNEERLLALIILENQYQSDNEALIYNFYLSNITQVNNWNLVDQSAHNILGRYLFNRDKKLLFQLAESSSIWERRIAIVATWHFIRKGQFDDTIKIAQILLNDEHDLIHKATGWMLREMGKMDKEPLLEFLKQYSAQMPRTMLRYAIEKFPQDQRKEFLLISSIKPRSCS